jgi:hypothetical protein
MDSTELLQAKNNFEGRLTSLENDARRAFVPITDIRAAPFPIAMYAFATIDHFSSFWAGWNDRNNKPATDTRNQTKRMADFLEKYLLYPQKESQLAVTVWRHKLMHTGEPRLLKENSTVYNWSISDQTNKHWTVENTGKDECLLSVGIYNLISDLRQGVFGPQGYFWELRVDGNLQNNYANFLREIQNYSFAIQI